MADLHVYEDDYQCVWVVAESADDARVVWCDSMGERVEDYLDTEFHLFPDDRVIKCSRYPNLMCAPIVGMTARQWVKENGRGFLCTTEW